MAQTQIRIERCSHVSEKDFTENFLKPGIPVILTDITERWNAMQTWNFDFFKKNYGSTQAGTMLLNDDQCDADTYRDTPEGRGEVAAVIAALQNDDAPSKRVIASPVENFPQSLRNDYHIPPYCAGGKFLRSRIYIGPAGVVTPLHHDLPENLYVLIQGKKRITLYHPADKKYLYANSIFSKHPNFSRIDPERRDEQKFPLSRFATPLIVNLSAGETLFIPSLWWHHLRNLEPSIAMNFWWNRGWKSAIAWGAAMYKRIRS